MLLKSRHEYPSSEDLNYDCPPAEDRIAVDNSPMKQCGLRSDTGAAKEYPRADLTQESRIMPANDSAGPIV